MAKAPHSQTDQAQIEIDFNGAPGSGTSLLSGIVYNLLTHAGLSVAKRAADSGEHEVDRLYVGGNVVAAVERLDAVGDRLSGSSEMPGDAPLDPTIGDAIDRARRHVGDAELLLRTLQRGSVAGLYFSYRSHAAEAAVLGVWQSLNEIHEACDEKPGMATEAGLRRIPAAIERSRRAIGTLDIALCSLALWEQSSQGNDGSKFGIIRFVIRNLNKEVGAVHDRAFFLFGTNPAEAPTSPGASNPGTCDSVGQRDCPSRPDGGAA